MDWVVEEVVWEIEGCWVDEDGGFWERNWVGMVVCKERGIGFNVGIWKIECWTELQITAGGVLEGVVYWFGEWEGGCLSVIVVIWGRGLEGGLCWGEDVTWEVEGGRCWYKRWGRIYCNMWWGRESLNRKVRNCIIRKRNIILLGIRMNRRRKIETFVNTIRVIGQICKMRRRKFKEIIIVGVMVIRNIEKR